MVMVKSKRKLLRYKGAEEWGCYLQSKRTFTALIRFSDAMDSRCKQISRNTVCMGVSLSISPSRTRVPFANAFHSTSGMSCRSPSRWSADACVPLAEFHWSASTSTNRADTFKIGNSLKSSVRLTIHLSLIYRLLPSFERLGA